MKDPKTKTRAAPSGWRSRQRIGGQWRSPEDAPAAPKTEWRSIAVKLTVEELAEFDARIGALGLNRNRALRKMMRQAGGFLEPEAGVLEEFREIRTQLVAIARGINRIARSANRTHDPDYRAFMAERERLGGPLARLGDVARRRADGRTRLSGIAGDGQ